MATATIPAGATGLSAAVDLKLCDELSEVVGFIMPAVWATADMTFQVCTTVDGTYQNLYDDNATELTVKAAPSRTIGLRQDVRSVLSRWRFVKVRSGTSGSPVNQTSGAAIEIMTK